VRLVDVLALTILLVLSHAASVAAGAASSYPALLARVRNSPPPAPIEELFELGMSTGDSLALPGFTILDDGIYEGSIPDPAFFAELARRHGDAADTAFFAAFGATSASGILPVYVEQMTDYSGCTRFGTGSLVETYGLWRAFLALYPHRYEKRARDQVDEVLDELVSGECACEGRAAVMRELELFLSKYPRDRSSARVRERLRDVRSGTAKVREHCRPG